MTTVVVQAAVAGVGDAAVSDPSGRHAVIMMITARSAGITGAAGMRRAGCLTGGATGAGAMDYVMPAIVAPAPVNNEMAG